MPINRTSHPQGREREERIRQSRNKLGSDQIISERERRVTELLLVVRRPSQEQNLARLFFLVLLIIISPRGNPPHHTPE